MDERKSTIEEIAVGGCTFLLGYILLGIAMFLNSPILLVVGFVTLFASSSLIRKLDPVTLKGCASTGMSSFFGIGLLIALLSWRVNTTTTLFAFCFTPAGFFLAKALHLSGIQVFNGLAYLKKSHKEIKDHLRQ
jgi:hypothetical protein